MVLLSRELAGETGMAPLHGIGRGERLSALCVSIP